MTKTPTDDRARIFFAYQGRPAGKADENVEAIRKAITSFNQHQKKYKAESWEEYRKTTVISREVLEAIRTAEIFACDITHFNHNVLFELGYAIGKRKSILIFLNQNVANAETIYRDFFLKDIRYSPLTNSQDVHTALQHHRFEEGLLEKLVNISNIEPDSNDLLYVQCKTKNQPSVDLDSALESFRKEKCFLMLTDDASEISYRPVDWYFQSIIKSRCILIHLLGDNIVNAFMENAKNSFLAGLASGLDRDVFLAAPAKYKAPLDYSEILCQYEQSEDLVKKTIAWLSKHEAIFQRNAISEEEAHELDLIKLGIGCEVAEEEKDGLLSYFVDTASYNAVLQQQKSIIVGRKGSGKSAIYIKAAAELQKDSTVFVVTLKPESVDLLEDIEVSRLFETDASKASFYNSVWKLVITSKLTRSAYERILNRDGSSRSEEEQAIVSFVEEHEHFLELNIFGLLKEISSSVKKKRRVEAPQALEQLYATYLTPMSARLKSYFKSINARYIKVVVLADNLDKTWDAQNNLEIQADLIASLLEVGPQIRKLLIDSKGQLLDFRQVVFLRKDIFEYLLTRALEPDKLTTMAHEINWEQYPGLLKRVIDDRFKHIRGLETSDQIEATWTNFFNFKDKKHPFKVIEEIVTLRPRDVIYFVSRLFESAVNNGHSKVDNIDLEHAIASYTSFLNNNLIAETRAEYPEITTILAKLQEHHGKTFEYTKLIQVFNSVGYSPERRDSLVRVLFEKNYMLGYDEKTNTPFSDIETLRRKLKERRFFFFKNTVYVIAHAKYYFIRNRTFRSF